MTLPKHKNDREYQKFVETSGGDVAVRTVLESGDIQIGAVEIKDATTENRVVVDDSGALKVTGGASSVAAQYTSPS